MLYLSQNVKFDRNLGYEEKNLNTLLTKEGLEILCNRLCYEPKIRFCGIINSMGKAIACGFKNGIHPLNKEEQRQMLYIESSLELSMKNEFNDTLGNVNFIATYRDNLALITIPIKQNYLLLISAERNASIENIVKNAINFFESNNLLDETKEPISKNKNFSIFSECA